MDKAEKTVGSKDASSAPECFIVMPISDTDGYIPGHFMHVYNDIIAPACSKAGFRPVRADDVKQTNLIHLDVLQRLLNTPMCLCDLSTRNPNVLFELALRQAFDKPVALIQETGTKQIFDIAPLRYTDYRKERIYHEVLEDQEKIAKSMKETFDAFHTGKGINSIVRLLSLSQPARLAEPGEHDRQSDINSLILAEMEQMRGEFRAAVRAMQQSSSGDDLSPRFARQYNELQMMIHRLESVVLRPETADRAVAEIEMMLAEARSNLRELMTVQRHSDRDMNLALEADQRLDRIEVEFRRLLESRRPDRSRTRPSPSK